MEITLEQLLKSRDQRWDRERRLLQEFPGQTLVVLTVVMPGRVKRNAHTRVIARAAEAAVQAFLGPKVVLRYTNDAPTGYEAYWIVRAEARSVKRQMCGIEDFHPLGRLFDLDVIQSDATPSRAPTSFRAAPLPALRSGGPLVHAQSYPHAGGDPPAHRRDGERV